MLQSMIASFVGWIKRAGVTAGLDSIHNLADTLCSDFFFSLDPRTFRGREKLAPAFLPHLHLCSQIRSKRTPFPSPDSQRLLSTTRADDTFPILLSATL